MKKIILAVVLLSLSLGAFAKLPAISLKDINGKTINTQELNNDGRPFVVSFFATWCKPCMRELDAINEKLADWEEETGVKVFIVSTDQAQDVNKVKPYVNGKGWDFEVLLDPNSDFKRAMNVSLIPHIFVIDANGEIAYQHQGYTDGSEEHVIEVVRELIK